MKKGEKIQKKAEMTHIKMCEKKNQTVKSSPFHRECGPVFVGNS